MITPTACHGSFDIARSRVAHLLSGTGLLRVAMALLAHAEAALTNSTARAGDGHRSTETNELMQQHVTM